ncbi:MAG: glycosyltransferase family 2 protein [Acidilobaceae archaeon]
MKISIVIPTFNEADSISRLISDIRRNLELNGYNNFEIIIVDDNSPDGTWMIVDEESRRDSRVKLIRRINIRGLGSAIVDGMRASTGDYIIVMDADYQHPPEVIPELIKRAISIGADIVVASRYSRGGGVRGWSLLRKIISYGALIIAYILIAESRRTRDPISGFFLVKRGVDIGCVKGKGYKVLLEILVANPNAKVIDVPYVFRERLYGESKLGLKDIIDYIIQVLELSRISKFAVVGASGIPVNLGVMALMLALGSPVDIASLAGIESSIAWNYLWHEVWTFKYMFRGGVKGVASRFVGYHVSVILGAATQYAVMRILYTILSLNPLIGQLLGIIAGFIVNYTIARRIVWIKPRL